MRVKQGVIYYASGDRYVQMALASAASLKKVMPHMPVKLYTSGEVSAGGAVDSVCRVPDEGAFYKCKLRAFEAEKEFERFAFLDADTLVLRDFTHVFDILDRFDLAASHEPFRVGEEFGQRQGFEELNTGVVFLRQTTETRQMIADWMRVHEEMEVEHGSLGDQKSLRPVLYQSALQLWVLTPEYNYRSVYPGFVGCGSPVYIMHGPQCEGAAALLNSSNDFRVFLNAWTQFKPSQFGFISERSQKWFLRMMRMRGILQKLRGKSL